MADHAEIEIIGFSYGSCGPFPCNEQRSCDLHACSPSENLVKAVDALKDRLMAEYPGQVAVKFTLLDDGVPDYVQKIVEEHQPPLPIILVNGRVTPVGRISMPLIKKEIDAALN
ncbi:hypothetical protein E2N92_02280 [Methanofollis formosanus]|uniref:Uncharacterized protein n=1 Tax=Methanofollis formosanus TaxID=299308 RepID=A0A8G1A0V0_9EURY|nr:hypothetical protein [Methanofollis formosanus]QYZ78339.1 hypothetical protein E2N92_02280 [Methanofollis formosanus]